jgi:hypothetical protein
MTDRNPKAAIIISQQLRHDAIATIRNHRFCSGTSLRSRWDDCDLSISAPTLFVIAAVQTKAVLFRLGYTAVHFQHKNQVRPMFDWTQ